MTNALKQFRDDYAGQDTTRMMDLAVHDIVKFLKKAQGLILYEWRTAAKQPSFTQYNKQLHFMKQSGKLLDEFLDEAGKNLKKALEEIARYQTRIAFLGEVSKGERAGEDFKGEGRASSHNLQWHLDFNRDYANKQFEDAFTHIAAQTDRMKSALKKLLRDEAATVFRRAAVEGISRPKAYRLLRDDIFRRDPNFTFIDRSGRQWDSQKYLEMLTKTVMAQTMREVEANVLTNEGLDLVRVSKIGTTCEKCKPWEGKIISLTGATEGYPTMAEAIDSGLFHPRCKHSFTAYNQEFEEVR